MPDRTKTGLAFLFFSAYVFNQRTQTECKKPMANTLFNLLGDSVWPANNNNADIKAAQNYIGTHGPALVDWLTRNDSLFQPQDIEDALLQPQFEARSLSTNMRKTIAHELTGNRDLVYPLHVDNKPFYSAVSLARTEKHLFERAAMWAQDGTPQIDPRFLSDSINAHQKDPIAKGKNPKPLEDITQASTELLTPGRFKILIGPPGAGKTTVIKLVGNSLHAAGKDVVLSAQSGMLCQKLGRETKQSTIPLSDLVARLEDETPSETATLRPGTTLIVDEAAMLGTRQMAKLFDVVERHDLNLMLIGDVRQISAATAGSPMRKMLEFITPSQLSTVTRQKDPIDAKATSDLYHQKPMAALRSYDQRGQILFSDNQNKLREDVTRAFVDWQEKHTTTPDPEYGDDKKAVILTITRQEATTMNQLVRTRMKDRGLIGKQQTIQTDDGPMMVASGEPLIIRQRLEARDSQDQPQTIYKGSCAKFQGLDWDGGIILTLEGQQAPLKISPDPELRLSYGYALELAHRDPADSPQGSSMTRVFTMIEGPITAGQALVGLSRHKRK